MIVFQLLWFFKKLIQNCHEKFPKGALPPKQIARSLQQSF